MNGVERYYSTKNLMVFLAFLKVGWLQITAHFLYFKFVLACTFFFFSVDTFASSTSMPINYHNLVGMLVLFLFFLLLNNNVSAII